MKNTRLPQDRATDLAALKTRIKLYEQEGDAIRGAKCTLGAKLESDLYAALKHMNCRFDCDLWDDLSHGLDYFQDPIQAVIRLRTIIQERQVNGLFLTDQSVVAALKMVYNTWETEERRLP